jgi:hypothetical protein
VRAPQFYFAAGAAAGCGRKNLGHLDLVDHREILDEIGVALFGDALLIRALA